MGAVTARQAGIGSAVNDTTRLLGGTLGVAIIGSVASSVYSARLADTLPSVLPAGVTDTVTESLGGALAVTQQLIAGGQQEIAGVVQSSAFEAYVHAVSIGCYVSVGLAAVGALLAWSTSRRSPRRTSPPSTVTVSTTTFSRRSVSRTSS